MLAIVYTERELNVVDAYSHEWDVVAYQLFYFLLYTPGNFSVLDNRKLLYKFRFLRPKHFLYLAYHSLIIQFAFRYVDDDILRLTF